MHLISAFYPKSCDLYILVFLKDKLNKCSCSTQAPARLRQLSLLKISVDQSKAPKFGTEDGKSYLFGSWLTLEPKKSHVTFNKFLSCTLIMNFVPTKFRHPMVLLTVYIYLIFILKSHTTFITRNLILPPCSFMGNHSCYVTFGWTLWPLLSTLNVFKQISVRVKIKSMWSGRCLLLHSGSHTNH